MKEDFELNNNINTLFVAVKTHREKKYIEASVKQVVNQINLRYKNNNDKTINEEIDIIGRFCNTLLEMYGCEPITMCYANQEITEVFVDLEEKFKNLKTKNSPSVSTRNNTQLKYLRKDIDLIIQLPLLNNDTILKENINNLIDSVLT